MGRRGENRRESRGGVSAPHTATDDVFLAARLSVGGVTNALAAALYTKRPSFEMRHWSLPATFCPVCKWSLTDCPSCGALQCRCLASIPIDNKLKVHAGIRKHWR